MSSDGRIKGQNTGSVSNRQSFTPRSGTWGIKRGGYTPVPTGHRTATPPPPPVDRRGHEPKQGR